MQQINKKRKLLIMLPLFVLPILLLGYLILGNKNSSSNQDAAPKKESAFNAELPAANLTETGKNKLELYMQAQKEAAKRKEALEDDPYEQHGYNPAPSIEIQQEKIEQSKYAAMVQGQDANEKKVKDRLDKLTKALNQPADIPATATLPTASANVPPSQTDELETLLSTMQHQENNPDPEMDQINAVLEKALDLKYPERVKERQNAQTNKAKTTVLKVSTTPDEFPLPNNHFYGLEEKQTIIGVQENTTIQAVKDKDQTVTDGSTITLRLLQDVFVAGQYIPKGNTISGTCAIGDQRINVQLTDIICNNKIYPIALTVYDMDGMLGIHVEGASNAQPLKNDMNQAIQSMDVLDYNPSLAAQAASTGIQTAKGLLSRKIRKVQATIKAGHKVLLKMSSR